MAKIYKPVGAKYFIENENGKITSYVYLVEAEFEVQEDGTDVIETPTGKENLVLVIVQPYKPDGFMSP